MLRAPFKKPLTILVGLGFPRRICSAFDALCYIEETPTYLRDLAFDAIRASCLDALDGRLDAEELRDLVCAFARRRGVLIEDPWTEPALPAQVDSPAP